ncbi:MAG: MBL fold metallo-hydrolase [Acidobacteria bacterium]|nr:MBL fold metallo-hydrolase [Acidobacteriota bacterium]
MIEPVLKHEAFLADVSSANHPGEDFRLWWLGQSGFLLQWQGRHVLLDPYLSDSLTAKYANTDKPHIRMTAKVIDPARLDFIDVVSASHLHTDHLDPETLKPLRSANAGLTLIVPEAIRNEAAARLGASPEGLLGLDDGQAANASEFRFNGVASAHEILERDGAGHYRYLGYVVQFGYWTLYHSGDVVLYDGLLERLRRFPIDVALLPINGRSPERRVAGNLNAREAAWLGRQMGARTVIPCHYEMFTFNTACPEDFVTAARELGQRADVPRCGARWESSTLGCSAAPGYRTLRLSRKCT